MESFELSWAFVDLDALLLRKSSWQMTNSSFLGLFSASTSNPIFWSSSSISTSGRKATAVTRPFWSLSKKAAEMS
jgi:hypothetical protein